MAVMRCPTRADRTSFEDTSALASQVGTPIDVDHLTRDKPGTVAGEPRNCLRDFLRSAMPCEQRVVSASMIRVRGRTGGVTHGVDHSGSNTVDRKSVRRQFVRVRARHARQAGLCSDHVQSLRRAGMTGHAAYFDDGWPLRLS